MLRGQYAFFDIILLYSSRLSFSLPRRTQRLAAVCDKPRHQQEHRDEAAHDALRQHKAEVIAEAELHQHQRDKPRDGREAGGGYLYDGPCKRLDERVILGRESLGLVPVEGRRQQRRGAYEVCRRIIEGDAGHMRQLRYLIGHSLRPVVGRVREHIALSSGVSMKSFISPAKLYSAVSASCIR